MMFGGKTYNFTPAQEARLTAAIDDFITDLQLVMGHFCTVPTNWPAGLQRAQEPMRQVLDAFQRGDIPSWPLLRHVCRHVLWKSNWNRRFRSLTEQELDAEQAAQRLLDGLTAAEHQLVRRFH